MNTKKSWKTKNPMKKNKMLNIKIGTFYLDVGLFGLGDTCLFGMSLLNYTRPINMLSVLYVQVFKFTLDFGFNW